MTERSPNVLWIMSDQHHAACWEGGGREDVQTPNLKALAESGIVYERAYCNNPICGPSRACFLTGQYAGNHGLTGNCVQGFQGEAKNNLARSFRQSGYQTGIIGKAHLPKKWLGEGFEYQRLCDLADADPEDPRSVHYFKYLVEQGLADDFDLGGLPTDHPGASMRAFTSAIPYAHSVENWTGNEALHFLEQRDPKRPFFLQLSFQRPHDPYAPSEESMGQYEACKLTLPPTADEVEVRRFEGKPKYQQDYVNGTQKGYPYVPNDSEDLKRQLAHYYTLISVIDAQIGRIMDWLKAAGIEEETIVVYHADHGDFAGEHGLMLKNLGIYEAIHRIPFILRYPGCHAGRESGMIESVDLFPTLCALAGLPLPAGLDGRCVAGVDAEFSKSVICEWDWGKAPQSRVIAVRLEKYRFVYYMEAADDGELYDLEQDPGEIHNLYDSSSMKQVREKMLQIALSHLLSGVRRLGIDHDRAIARLSPPGLTRRVFKHGVKWSSVCDSVMPSKSG